MHGHVACTEEPLDRGHTDTAALGIDKPSSSEDVDNTVLVNPTIEALVDDRLVCIRPQLRSELLTAIGQTAPPPEQSQKLRRDVAAHPRGDAARGVVSLLNQRDLKRAQKAGKKVAKPSTPCDVLERRLISLETMASEFTILKRRFNEVLAIASENPRDGDPCTANVDDTFTARFLEALRIVNLGHLRGGVDHNDVTGVVPLAPGFWACQSTVDAGSSWLNDNALPFVPISPFQEPTMPRQSKVQEALEALNVGRGDSAALPRHSSDTCTFENCGLPDPDAPGHEMLAADLLVDSWYSKNYVHGDSSQGQADAAVQTVSSCQAASTQTTILKFDVSAQTALGDATAIINAATQVKEPEKASANETVDGAISSAFSGHQYGTGGNIRIQYGGTTNAKNAPEPICEDNVAQSQLAHSIRIRGITAVQTKLADIEGLGFTAEQLCKFAAIAFLQHTSTDINIEHIIDDIGKLLAANAASLNRSRIAEICYFVW